jgi:hypothetical protein
LIHAHRIPRQGGEIAFNFQDGGRLRRLYVTPEQQRSLVAGRMALVRQDEEVELVPRAIAENLLNHRASLVLVLNHPATEQAVAKAEEEDPYASYQVPDDLIW